MNTKIAWLVLLGLGYLPLWGQEILRPSLPPLALTPDSLTVVVHLAQPLTPATFPVLPAAWVASASNTDRPQIDHTVLQLHRAPGAALPSLVRAWFGPDAQVTTGYRLPGGFPIWLGRQLLFRPRPGQVEAAYAALTTAYPGGQPAPTVQQEVHALALPADAGLFAAARLLLASGTCVWAHPDFIVPVAAASPPPVAPCLPADPFFSGAPQYYLHNTGGSSTGYPFTSRTADVDIDAPEAWCNTLGAASIVVAVIDEGVEDHEDLMDDVTGLSRVLPGFSTQNPLGTGGPELPEDAHGQAVAGIIAASHNTIGVAGVAPAVHILPVHVFTDGTAPVSVFAQAIDWAWQNGADVLNNSWVFPVGFPLPPQVMMALEQAISDATALGRHGRGAVVVFASGTGPASGGTPVLYPATLPQVLAVGAIDPTGSVPAYAGQGPELDVVSVSSNNSINSVTVMDRMGNNGYNPAQGSNWADVNYTRWFGGTSVSSATASGVAALVLSVNPGLHEAAVRNILQGTTVDVGPAGFDPASGFGIINADLAVQAAENSLPVTWLGLEAREAAGRVTLRWTTGFEAGNAYFVVERWDGAAFEAQAEVAAQGWSDVPVAYTWEDRWVPPGRQRYRIRQVDFDGAATYSPEVEVTVTGGGFPVLWPNPAQETVSVWVPVVHPAPLTWELLDLQGRVVRRGQVPAGLSQEAFAIDLSGLVPGLYQMMLQGAETERQVLPLRVE